MDGQRHVIIVSENPYYRTVYRETLAEAGFSVEDQVSPVELAEHLRRSPEINLLLLEQDLEETNAVQLLRELNEAGAEYPSMRTVCLVEQSVGSRALEELKSAGFSGVIPLDATPELIVFRVNDLIFSEEVKQRKNIRAPVSIRAQVQLGNELSEGLIISLSKQGLFLKSKLPLAVNSQIVLDFTLPKEGRGGGTRLQIPGRVTLVKGSTGPEDIYFGPGMVVIFEELETEILELLDDFVAGELIKL